MGRGLKVLHNLNYINSAAGPSAPQQQPSGGSHHGGQQLQGGAVAAAPSGPTAAASSGPIYSVIIEQRGKSDALLMENHAIVTLSK